MPAVLMVGVRLTFHGFIIDGIQKEIVFGPYFERHFSMPTALDTV